MSEIAAQSGRVPASSRAADQLPLTSIIMSMHNSAATVASAIRSLQAQTLPDWELIVIDDGSSDNSCAIVEALGDPRIRLIRDGKRLGLAARLNQAVGLSRSEFITRMDADDLCFPDRLRRQVTHLTQRPEIDVLGCGAVVFANDARLLGELPVGLTHEAITAQPFYGFPLPHPTWCGRGTWFRANPYDPKLMKTQDQDLLLRTFRYSRFAAVDDVLVGYRQDTLDLGKLLRGRTTYIGSLWRHSRRSGELLPVLNGVAAHLFKGGIDIAIAGLGISGRAQRLRLKPVRPQVATQWLDLRKGIGLSEEASKCAG